MARTFQFDVDIVVKKLNQILQMELAAVIYYTHYFMVTRGFRSLHGCAITHRNHWLTRKRLVR